MSRPRSTVARDTALAAAVAMVLDEGVAALSFEGLARRSGVAKTTLYRHWERREDLLHAVLSELVVDVPTPDTGDLRGDLVALADELPGEEADAVARRAFFLLMQAATVDPAVRDVKDEMVAQRTVPIRAIVERAIERGELDIGADLDVAVDLIMGPFVVRRLIRGLDLSDAVRDRTVDATLAALRTL